MQEKFTKKIIFSFFGPPGSGKGTLAEKCVKNLGFYMLSTGNLCRKHISLGTEFGKLINKYIKVGQLIPDNLVINMVGDWLISKTSEGTPIILDGFPRTKKQAEFFLKTFHDFVPDYSFRLVYFIVSDEEIIRRLENRFVCENKNCQAVYPPFAAAVKKMICDLCGEKIIKRTDDTMEIIKNRLKLYSEYRDDLLTFYKSKHVKIDILDVENKTIDQVFENFKIILKNI